MGMVKEEVPNAFLFLSSRVIFYGFIKTTHRKFLMTLTPFFLKNLLGYFPNQQPTALRYHNGFWSTLKKGSSAKPIFGRERKKVGSALLKHGGGDF